MARRPELAELLEIAHASRERDLCLVMILSRVIAPGIEARDRSYASGS